MKLTADTKLRLVNKNDLLVKIDPYPTGQNKVRLPWWRWLPDWIINKPYGEARDYPEDLSDYPSATVLAMPDEPNAGLDAIKLKVGDRILLTRHFICREDWGQTAIRIVDEGKIVAVIG